MHPVSDPKVNLQMPKTGYYWGGGGTIRGSRGIAFVYVTLGKAQRLNKMTYSPEACNYRNCCPELKIIFHCIFPVVFKIFFVSTLYYVLP